LVGATWKSSDTVAPAFSVEADQIKIQTEDLNGPVLRNVETKMRSGRDWCSCHAAVALTEILPNLVSPRFQRPDEEGTKLSMPATRA
jgi:hypothetical protein